MSIFTKNRPPLPAEWRHIDALTEPGPDASPAARLHHAALKMLRALSLLAGSRIDQQPTSAFSLDSLHWTHAQHYWLRLSPYVDVGPAHDAVLCLTDVFGGAHTYADGFDASVPHTNDEWADAMVPVPPCEVPTEPELRAMAEACMRERGTHWDVLDPCGAPPANPDFLERRRKLLIALWQEEALAPEKALTTAELLKRSQLDYHGKFPEQVLNPLIELGLVHRARTDKARFWMTPAFGQPS